MLQIADQVVTCDPPVSNTGVASMRFVCRKGNAPPRTALPRAEYETLSCGARLVERKPRKGAGQAPGIECLEAIPLRDNTRNVNTLFRCQVRVVMLTINVVYPSECYTREYFTETGITKRYFIHRKTSF